MHRFRSFATKTFRGTVAAKTVPPRTSRPFTTTAPAVRRPNNLSYDFQQTIHVSEIEGEISRIQGLVKSVKAMTGRIEKHVEERDDDADDNGCRLSGPLYDRRKRRNAAGRVPSMPLLAAYDVDDVSERLKNVNRELVEAFERLREVDGKFQGRKWSGETVVVLDDDLCI